MGLEQRSTEDKYYEISDEFLESMDDFGVRTRILIAKHIEEYTIVVPSEELVSHHVGGVIDDPDHGATPFAIEIMRIDKDLVMLTDIKLISMDEYLDLINLNLYFKPNQDDDKHTKSKATKRHSQQDV
jgi:hypothetical protein